MGPPLSEEKKTALSSSIPFFECTFFPFATRSVAHGSVWHLPHGLEQLGCFQHSCDGIGMAPALVDCIPSTAVQLLPSELGCLRCCCVRAQVRMLMLATARWLSAIPLQCPIDE